MRTLALAVVLSTVACGTPGDSSVDTTGAPPTTSPPMSTTVVPDSTTQPPVAIVDIDPDDLGLVVVPDADGGFASDLLVGCEGEPGFPLSAVEQLTVIDDADPDGYLAAIEPFLTSGEGEFWPQDGWRLLWADETAARLVTRAEEGGLAWMYLQKEGGEWTWSGSSLGGAPCQLRVATPSGMNTVDWRLDPSHPNPTSESTQIHLLLNERECVDGREIGDRLRGPQVVLTPDEVRIVFVAETPPGDAFTCPGNPDTPYLLELPQPLGERELVDGFDVGVTLDDYVD